MPNDTNTEDPTLQMIIDDQNGNCRYKGTFIASDIDIDRHIHHWTADVKINRAKFERRIIR